MATPLVNFLTRHAIKNKKDNDKITHTRIGDKTNRIFGGSYSIGAEAEDEFYNLYYGEVIQGNRLEYLTEKQIKDDAIYVDLDFRYVHEVSERQHEKQWVDELLEIYLKNLKKYVNFTDAKFKIYVMQKDGVNRLADRSLTKDGVHIIIGIKLPNKIQLKLREAVITDSAELLERLPLINTPESVFDIGLCKGTTNAQLFGSRKPSCDAYKLVYAYHANLDPADGEFCMHPFPADLTKETFLDLCVRNNQNRLELPLTPLSVNILNPELEVQRKKDRQQRGVFEESANNSDFEKLFELYGEHRCEHGSYKKWYSLAQACVNTLGQPARPLWIKFTQDYGTSNKKDEADALWDRLTPTEGDGSLGMGSLHYWAREDNPIQYDIYFKKQSEIIRKNEYEPLLDAVIEQPTDLKYALLFLNLYGNKYRSVDNKRFYQFTDKSLWVRTEGGSNIKNCLDTDLLRKFKERTTELTEKRDLYEATDDQYKKYDEVIKTAEKAQLKLENVPTKNNIFSGIADKIYQPDFEVDMNKQKYLLPIKNKKIINMNTLEIIERTIAHKFNYECDAEMVELTEAEEADIRGYFLSLFCGKEDTMMCVLDIIKSSFTGQPLKHIFFSTGTGSNGKSVLFNILKAIFKNAMDIISQDVILVKKSNSHLNTELEKLDRVRFAYITELTERDKINVKNVKAITGGDPIDVRGICKTNETLQATCNLHVLTNEMPTVKIDPAILQRLVIMPFNNRFPINPLFEAEMLEKRNLIFSFIMKYGTIRGDFEDHLTSEMRVAKDNYKNENSVDVIQEFTDAMLEMHEGSKIPIIEVRNAFKIWCNNEGYKTEGNWTPTKITQEFKKKNIITDENKKYCNIVWAGV